MSRNRRPTFYEFFAGGGMARLGLGDGWDCLFANDFDPMKAAAYRANFADADRHFRQGDVWDLTAADLPGQADLAWASSPCQDFSLAGLRAGLKGGRSSAFFGFWKLVEALNAEGRAPRTIVIENVVGLLTSHAGADFTALCQALADQGYRFGALEIDAVRFVPQSRPRVFVLATQLPIPPNIQRLEQLPPFHSKRVTTAFDRLPAKLQDRWVWWKLDYPPTVNEAVDQKLEADRQVKWMPEGDVNRLLSLLSDRHKKKLQIAKERGDRIIGTLFRRMRHEDGEAVQRAELNFSGIAGCLRTSRGGSSQQFIVVVQSSSVKIRQIVPREAARLMGLEESYKLPERRGAALSLLGDGVVVPVVDFLSRQIIRPLVDQAGYGEP